MAYSQSWLEDPSAIRGILAEVTVYDIAQAQNIVLYLSTFGYLTADGITSYNPIIIGAPSISESMSLDNTISMSVGDIELNNTNGTYDSWLDSSKFIWANKPIVMYVGDPSWVCSDLAQVQADFLKIFDGVIVDIDSSGRDVLNIKLADKLQRLNCSITETVLGNYGNWSSQQQADSVKDTVIPLVFGEVFNITPVLIDPSQLEYSFSQGASERLIELRDNGVPIYSTKENLLTYSEQFDNAIWGKILGATVATNTTLSPSGEVNADTLNFTTSSGNRLDYSLGSVDVNGTTYTFSVWLKGSGTMAISINTTTGIGGQTEPTITLSNSWVRYSTTVTYSNPTGNMRAMIIWRSGHTATSVNMWGAQFNSGPEPLSYVQTSISAYTYTAAGTTVNLSNSTFKLSKPLVGTLTASVQGSVNSTIIPNGGTATSSTVYNNNIISIVSDIITRYGTNKLSLSDLDTSNIYTLYSSTIPVGIYIQDRGNVLQICQDLLSSISAQMYSNRLGKIQVLQIGTYTNDPIVYITESDTILQSLQIVNKTPVLASYKIGYCKNWTPQPSLVTNIPSEHKSMMADAWYSSTVTAPTTAITYSISTVPVQKDTLLITKTRADLEATKILSYSLNPRYVYKLTCTSNMLSLKLGQQVNLSNSRFGLSSGKSGQVVSLSPNWLSGTVDIEVLI